MDELIFVRHAETAWSGRRYCGRTDVPLTPAGEAAAERLGLELASSLSPPSWIVSSPLLRARHTAAAIAAAIGIDALVLDDRWAETDFGEVEGLTYEELEAAFPALAARLVKGDAVVDWPGGETAAALRTRVESALRDLPESPGTVIVVSHGGPLRLAIARSLGVDPAEVKVPAPGTTRRLERDPVLPFRA